MTVRVIRNATTEANIISEAWGSLRWLASERQTGTKLTLGRVIIAPGCSNPRHSHGNCEEVLYLLSGSLCHSLADVTVMLEAGDMLVVPAGVAHNATNNETIPADMIVAYTAGVRQFTLEAEPQETFSNREPRTNES